MRSEDVKKGRKDSTNTSNCGANSLDEPQKTHVAY